MKLVTMHHAKTHLSRLVELALSGEEIIIARRDQPLVRLVAVTATPNRRQIGGLPDLVQAMGENFDAPIEDWPESPFPRGDDQVHTRQGKTK